MKGGKVIRAADLFCGAGGTSTGLSLACRDAGLAVELLAVNHWDVAIDTHTANHPWARHLCESLDNVDPRKAIPGGRLNLLVASPECTHHSRARGGKPMSDQSRASAWHVLRWAEALYVENILVENVKEFADWGPLGANGLPLKSRRGETFRAFLDGLRSLGYRVDSRILNAADFGDPTTRERLFVQARRGNRRITWPEPTHAPRGGRTLFGDRSSWRPAREVIDWSVRGESIFRRKRPLAPRTLERIAEGLRRFGGAAAEPFLTVLRNNADARSLDEPVPALTAGGEHVALCEPYLIPWKGERDGQRPRTHSVDDPLPVVTASGPQFGLCEPFLVSYYGQGTASAIDAPVPTVTTKDRFGLVQQYGLDILFRMLQPHELAAAMGFPREYAFTGNRENRVRQIGNAVPVNLARALCSALLAIERPTEIAS